MEKMTKQFELEKKQIRKEAEDQYQQLLQREVKTFGYRIDSIQTMNDTLATRVHKYQDQERMLIETQHENEDLKKQIDELVEDNERIRKERKVYKDENHKLIKKVIQVEEALHLQQQECEDKVKDAGTRLIKYENDNSAQILQDKLNERSGQVNALIDRIQAIEDESSNISKCNPTQF